jgi:cytochrome c oxidase subunit 3
MKSRIILDAEDLPHHAYGHRMTTWWGTLAFIALEGTGLAMAGAAYLYIAWLNPDWPLSAAPPDLFWSTSLTLLLLLSAIPNAFGRSIARSENKGHGQIFLVLMSVIGIVACVLRGYEFTTLNVRWDDNAYGSLLWFMLGLHTTHLATDVVETLVLTALMFTKHAKGKRFSDVEDNATFWNFVVAAWVPIYALLYWFPRIWGQ